MSCQILAPLAEKGVQAPKARRACLGGKSWQGEAVCVTGIATAIGGDSKDPLSVSDV